jgi:CRP/FNR family transcriptional regulator, nitrogen oxide reductase regulator
MVTPELFDGLPDSACDEIFGSARCREFACGKRIFWPGDEIKEIFLLTEGRVKIMQVSQDGREVILRLHIPGQIIGPAIPTTRGTYSSVAQALQLCKTLVWSVVTFEKILSRYPLVYFNTQKILAGQTAELVHRIFEVREGNVPRRLAYGLLHLRNQIGREVNGQCEVDVTQETLAQMTGMTVATANRQLNRWEKQGMVTCFRNTIGIRDHLGLSDLCRNKQLAASETRVLNREKALRQQHALLAADPSSPEGDHPTA